MDIFRSNLPIFFDPSEEVEFSQFLREGAQDFYVLSEQSSVRACGGYFVDAEENRAGLAWGMVHRDFHKTGLGKKLLAFRLRKIQADFPGIPVLLNTSQHTYKFFERSGFEVEKVTPDGYGAGLDRYDMKLAASHKPQPLDSLSQLHKLRSVYDLSLAEAKEIKLQADGAAASLYEHQQNLAPTIAKVAELIEDETNPG